MGLVYRSFSMMPRLGRYETGRPLGQGGSGRVLEATLVGPGGFRVPVALQVLPADHAPEREARIGSELRHRNLVDVYEVGSCDGHWFIAMERCDGALSDHLPLPPRAVVEVGLQVCAALQYAHEALGLVHLDLKPANLLLKDGVVKVADLGIAQARGFQSRGRGLGTPACMAPEQRRGLPVDARADVYALGYTLIELALGRRPGADPTMDLDAREEVGGELGDDPVPAWLAAVTEPCLAPDPERRWTMSELAEALRALDVSGPGLDEALGHPARLPASRRPRGTPSSGGPRSSTSWRSGWPRLASPA